MNDRRKDYSDWAGQYILAADPVVVPGWEGRCIAGRYLVSHPSLPVVPVVAKHGQEVGTILGWPVSPGGELVKCMNLNGSFDVLGAVYQHGGRWLLVMEEELYLDPSGSQPAVYAPDLGIVASSPGLIDAEVDAELVDAFDVVNRDGWYPLGLTPKQGVHRLLPNHKLDLRSFKTERHHTAPSPGTMSVEKAAAVALKAIDAAGSAFADTGLFVGLTAGQDSRMPLAGLRDHLDNTQFWTPRSVARTNPIDVQIARTLAAHALHAPEGPRYWIRERGRLGYIDALADFVDAAVDVSGFLFSDQRGERTSERLVHVAEAFSRRGKPFVFLPQAWGPFEGQAVRELTRRACASADLVFARDTTSREHLEAILNSTANVEQAPDIAFLFQPATNGTELIAALGLDPERPIAAFSPNMRVYERTGGEGENNHYCSTLVRVGRELMAGGAQLLFLPHEILPPKESRPDDRYLCQLLADALGSADVAAVTDDRTAEDLKAMIGECDLMLGSRFHALIAALSSGVPSVAIGWAHKYPELLGEFGMEHLVFDHNSLTPDSPVKAVLEVWDSRVDYRAEINELLAGVKARSASVFDRTAAKMNRARR